MGVFFYGKAMYFVEILDGIYLQLTARREQFKQKFIAIALYIEKFFVILIFAMVEIGKNSVGPVSPLGDA